MGKEAPPGFEPGMADLQSAALPLGEGAGACGIIILTAFGGVNRDARQTSLAGPATAAPPSPPGSARPRPLLRPVASEGDVRQPSHYAPRSAAPAIGVTAPETW